MPDGTQSTIFTNVDNSAYVWGQQNGAFGRWPALLINTPATGVSTGGGGTGSGLTATAISSNTTAVKNTRYIVDTSVAGFTLTLPASPTIGDYLELIDSHGTFAKFPLIVTTTDNISGSIAPLTLDVSNISLGFTWTGDTTRGWQIDVGGDSTLTPPTTTIINNTAVSPDRLLLPGQTAFVDYVLATNVPLGIKTEEGLYELAINGDTSLAITNGNAVSLNPNNSTQTAGAIDVHELYSTMSPTNAAAAGTVSVWVDGVSSTAFRISCGIPSMVNFKISTRTVDKSCTGDSLSLQPTLRHVDRIANYWGDTTTVWTSLGTLVFPFAQSGKVIIRRII